MAESLLRLALLGGIGGIVIYLIRALDRIEGKLSTLNTEIKYMTKAEAAKLDKITNDIKARFEALMEKLEDTPTPEEQAEIDKDFATLEALGADPDNPIPVA